MHQKRVSDLKRLLKAKQTLQGSLLFIFHPNWRTKTTKNQQKPNAIRINLGQFPRSALWVNNWLWTHSGAEEQQWFFGSCCIKYSAAGVNSTLFTIQLCIQHRQISATNRSGESCKRLTGISKSWLSINPLLGVIVGTKYCFVPNKLNWSSALHEL